MTENLTDRRVVTLDLTGVADKSALMDAVAHALHLPDWFGRNWDALLDSLSDPSVWPAEAGERGLLLVVTGWEPYAQARPDEWRVAREVFTEASERPAPLTVALALA
ncbi:MULTISPECIES: barstar family protein [unclassified Streptomyces]|uniref:barstar family protein n=1 Tax=unclassified Streptomyces TaxID=2593676 RepID=UPI003319CDDA